MCFVCSDSLSRTWNLRGDRLTRHDRLMNDVDDVDNVCGQKCETRHWVWKEESHLGREWAYCERSGMDEGVRGD